MISKSMPLISVQMYSGISQREKDRLAEATTEDVVKILKVGKEEVIVLFTEATYGNGYSAGVQL
jgi:4-oxalocrotonate tautomerase